MARSWKLGRAIPFARSWKLGRVILFLIGASRRYFDYSIDIALDAIFDIRTFIPVPKEPVDTQARNGRYEPLPYRSLRTIARHLGVSTEDALLDLGCGKGRVLCFFAKQRIAKCVGIEISRPLAHEAWFNSCRLQHPHAPIEVINADACDSEIGNASIVFMFNPFSAEVVRPVLAHIRQSLCTAPRKLRICYANPVEAALLDECAWLACTDEFPVMQNGWHACPVKIWTARPQPLPEMPDRNASAKTDRTVDRASSLV